MYYYTTKPFHENEKLKMYNTNTRIQTYPVNR